MLALTFWCSLIYNFKLKMDTNWEDYSLEVVEDTSMNPTDYGNFEGSLNDQDDSFVVTTIINVIMLVVGIIANALICFIVAKKRELQTSINFILVNLAVTDIYLAISYIIWGAVKMFTKSWIFGETMCIVSLYTLLLCEIFSIMSIAAPLVIMLFYQNISKLTCMVLIGWFWFLAAIIALPDLNLAQVLVLGKTKHCIRNVQEEGFSSIYPRVLSIALLLLLIGVVIVSIALYQLKNKRATNNPQETRSMLAIVIIYSLLTTPGMLMNNLIYFSDAQINFFYFQISYFATQLSTVYKPFVYLCFLNKFNKEFQDLL